MRNLFASIDGIAKMVSSSEGHVDEPNTATGFIALQVWIIYQGQPYRQLGMVALTYDCREMSRWSLQVWGPACGQLGLGLPGRHQTFDLSQISKYSFRNGA